MFRKIRIFVLLLVLATVGLEAWRTDDRLSAWKQTVHVGLFPIAGDDSPDTARFVAALDHGQFADIADWMREQSDRYGRSVLKPISVRVAAPVGEPPPLPPREPSALGAVLWTLQMRWWASRHDDIGGPTPDVRLFVLFHDPERSPVLPHSTGLSKGRIGVIHAFASPAQREQNAVVVAHELLHTFGATDKYDPHSLQPIYPQGYAAPRSRPLLPQRAAEIMAGRIPIDERRAEIPAGLAEAVIGPATATEIGLLRTAH